MSDESTTFARFLQGRSQPRGLPRYGGQMKTKMEAINEIIGVLRGRDADHRAELARQLNKLSLDCLNTLREALTETRNAI